MKLNRPFSMGALMVGSTTTVSFAWTATKPSITRFSSRSNLISCLDSTAATTAEESIFAAGSSGKVLAEGSVVSFFRGGLAAVQINDDDIESAGCNHQPKEKKESLMWSTTKVPPKETGLKSSTQVSDLIGRKVVLPGGLDGVVVAHRPPILYVYTATAEEYQEISAGTAVQVLDSMLTISVRENMSKMIDCFGRSEVANGASTGNLIAQRAMFSPIPQVKDIALINRPIVTGITMFDVLAPVGKGQNMLFVGQDIDAMRGYVVDMLKTQQRQGSKIKCVIAAASPDSKDLVERLKSQGLDEGITVVASSKDDVDLSSGADQKEEASSGAEAMAVAATACAVAETYALEQGLDTLVVVDNIDQLKTLWDATTRVLVDVFGVDAVVQGDREGGASSEMRAFYSSLIQRAAQFNKKKGGGSITLVLLKTIPGADTQNDEEIVFSPSDFDQSSEKIRDRINLLVKKNIPLTAANLRKIEIPIPSAMEGKRRLLLQHVDDLISMSDGQIWLDERRSMMPQMDIQRSLTRIGIGADTDSRADAPAMRRVVEGLRLDLAQASDVKGAETTTVASIRQFQKRNVWLLAMNQEPGTGGRTLAESCTVLLAVSKGYLDSMVGTVNSEATDQELQVVCDMLDHVKTVAHAALAEIDETFDMSDEARRDIEDALQSYFSINEGPQ